MVRTAPILASRYKGLTPEMQEIAVANGAVPVNEIFFDLWTETESKLWMLYGGYGSGKSVFVADYLIDHCLNDKYFKCLFGRKIKDTLRESVFDTICDRIEFRGLQDKFIYSRKPKSSMIIKCIDNDNIFIPFGSDKADKLKSVKDPTHIFCEEFDQFEENDFSILLTRLRMQGVRLLFIAAFNTKTVPPSHWIKKFFFNPDKPYRGKIIKRFCNYTDNNFIDHKDYEEVLWAAAFWEQEIFDQIAAGDWGTDVKENIWAYSFNKQHHVVKLTYPGDHASPLQVAQWEMRKRSMQIDRRLPLHLIFDFNVDPMTCLVAQRNGIAWAKIIHEYRLRNSDIYELLEQIKTDYPDHYLIATGDPAGRARNGNVKGKRSYVDTIKTELKLSNKQMQFAQAHPTVADTRILVNAVFKKHPDFKISSECQYLIDDLETVKTNTAGVLDKKKIDPLKTHLLDNLRYFIWNYFKGFVNVKPKK